VPAAVIPLVWNGMMSFGGGWFFLAASEAITVMNRDFLLPGVGSYLAVAVRAGDLRALAWALVTMAGMIVLVDALVLLGLARVRGRHP
jgi:NitT/TauT family transport system permease protein